MVFNKSVLHFIILLNTILVHLLVSLENDDHLTAPYIFHSVNVITGSYVESTTDISLTGYHPIQLRRCYQSQTAGNPNATPGWYFNHPSLFYPCLDKDKPLPSLSIKYDFDKENRLLSIKTLDEKGRKIQRWLDFNYSKEGDQDVCEMESDSQTKYKYFYQTDLSNHQFPGIYINRIEKNGDPLVSYQYTKHPITRSLLISQRNEPNGRFLQAEYYDQTVNQVGNQTIELDAKSYDSRWAKVKTLKAPVGCDAAPIATHHFIYGDGYTEVLDAHNHKVVYHYADFQRLLATDYYDEGEKLYRRERLEWQLNPSLPIPLLTKKVMEDGDGNILQARHFEYDHAGHLIKDTLIGNLTGKRDNESYSTTYRYQEDRLVEKQEGDHLHTQYLYKNERVIAEHLIVDKLFHHRKFFEYDDNGYLICAIEDDGCGQKCDDLTNVQCRSIIKYTYARNPAAIYLPESIQEFYWDPETKEERFLTKTVNEYSDKGNPISQRIFDALGNSIRMTTYLYDNHGRLISASEENGNVSESAYDTNGNLIRTTLYSPDGAVTNENYTYDFSNRLIRYEKNNHLGESKAIAHRYDYLGNKIADIDEGGNCISYSYDAFNRLSQIVYPSFKDAEDVIQTPIITYEYDKCDRVCRSIDPNKGVTTAVYNARGKPLEVCYPDGTCESFQYNPAGILVKEKDRTGLTTYYIRDGLGRATKTIVQDRNGQKLAETIAAYSSFHLIAEKDCLGKQKIYRYDGAGRQTSIIEQTQEGCRRLEFSYDERGRVLKKTILLSNESYAEVFEYGNGDLPIAMYIEDGDGNVFQRTDFQESKNNKILSREGFECNDLGQTVRYIEECDDQGNVVKIVEDALGKPSTYIKQNSLGQIIRHIEYRYDLLGNKTLEVHHNEGNTFNYILAWKYGNGKKLETSIEGKGSPRQRITTYTYNEIGKVDSLSKPDGTTLYFHYHPSGNVREVYSSDHSIHYHYQYDLYGNAIEVSDLLTNENVIRTYTSFNQLAEERLGITDIKTSYTYDQQGKRICMKLFDESSISYAYHGCQLQTIERLNKNNESIYSYSCLEYEEGKIKAASLPGGVGAIHFDYDQNGNLKSIKSPFWSQEIRYGAFEKNLQMITSNSGRSFIANYVYDDCRSIISEKGIADQNYEYDSLENRISGKCNELNELLEYEKYLYSYDVNGNLTSQIKDGQLLDFEYDAFDRLTYVTEPLKERIKYTYDGLNRRLSKTFYAWDSDSSEWILTSKQNYLYDGLNEIGSYNEDQQIQELRILGQGKGAEIGATIAAEIQGEVYAVINDIRGNIASLISVSTKEVVESYDYSAFGVMTVYDAYGDLIEESSIGMPWGFSSKRLDPETGLIYFGERYLNCGIGRWITPDPLKHLDGPNRYAYVHNDPIGNIDLYGEFTVGEVWHSASKMLRQGLNTLKGMIHVYQNKVGYAAYSRHEIEEFGNAILGLPFLRLTGFYFHNPEVGVLGKGEINDSVRITMINGILNIRSEYVENVALFSKSHGGVNIHYIFRPSDGWAHDLLKCVLSKSGMVSSQSELLAEKWKQLIQEMGGVGNGGLIIHYAHSIGGTETNNAKRLLSPEERMMIKIITLGSATLIPDTDFLSVINYVSWRDGVCYLDPIGYVRALLKIQQNVVFIGTPLGVPIIDHLLDNDSYMTIITALGEEFVRTYGSL